MKTGARVPYFKWRDGRPRWEPGPLLRKRGFKGRDLKDHTGLWLDRPAAIELAREINRDVKSAAAAALIADGEIEAVRVEIAAKGTWWAASEIARLRRACDQ